MTREQILELEAGPELDWLMAGKVMGWKRTTDGAPPGCAYWKDGDGFICATEDPGGNLNWNPSRDIAAAWEVVEDRRRWGWTWKMTGMPGHWHVALYNEEFEFLSEARAAELTVAICRAALLAMMKGEK